MAPRSSLWIFTREYLNEWFHFTQMFVKIPYPRGWAAQISRDLQLLWNPFCSPHTEGHHPAQADLDKVKRTWFPVSTPDQESDPLQIKRRCSFNATSRVYWMIYRGPKLSRRRKIWLLPNLLCCLYKLARRHTGRLRKRDNLLTGEGEGGGGGAKSYDGEKAWYSKKHALLSGYLNCINGLEPGQQLGLLLSVKACKESSGLLNCFKF